MDSERWKQVDSLLQSALDHPPPERDAFLREACAGDQALERELRSLLALEPKAERLMESPAIEVAARDLARRASLQGRTISHYRVVEKLGDGGMGVVWKARDTRLDRFVALKVLTLATMNDPERKRRFIREARSASALNHPHIITIHDIGEAEGLDFIAMEFVPGQTLDQLIPRKGLRLNAAIDYAIQVADALAAAHAAGIMHRDLTPGNVMVNQSGSVKVLDFGLAKLTEHEGGRESKPQTDEGMIVGTASYMSPEQAEGKKVDARTDIFSFGAVLYEMITGRRAFGGDSLVSILSAVLRDEPRPAAEIVSGLPGDVSRILARCLRKDPGRRYQHADDLKIDLEELKEKLASGDSAAVEEHAAMRRARGWAWAAAAVACGMGALAAGWWLHRPRETPPPSNLTQITTDGASDYPALSPDGKLVAYSSDRSQTGTRDLYVQQIAGGQPIRLTTDGAGNTEPDFSPDGSTIVFRSDRDGGGIYQIPALGGEIRLLARNGLDPKYSPDGSQVAYWVGSEEVAAAVPGSGTLWVVPSSGGHSQPVGPNLTSARYPVWSPDGRRLLAIGYASARPYESSALDMWLAPTDGGAAVKTGVYDALIRVKIRPMTTATTYAGPSPACWSPINNTVIFSVSNGDTQNLWEMGISPETGKVNGVSRRLTAGAGNELDASCASNGALAFANVETRREVWSLPFDLDRGKPKGTPERITQGPGAREHASLSGNGQYVAFGYAPARPLNIWMRDLATGKESRVARSPFLQRYPVASPSGDKVAYSSFEYDKRVVYVATPGGVPEKICDGCFRATDWSRDEKSVVVFAGFPYQINLLDLASHRQTPLVTHRTYNLLYGKFSPDNRWISFTVRVQPMHGRIAIAPLDGPKPVPESAWITVAEADAGDWASWSPDGKTLYFTSGRDGHSCFWAQRLDGTTHRPVGEPFSVLHLHGRVSHQQQLGWSLGGGRIAMVLDEDVGNIWMMSPSAAR